MAINSTHTPNLVFIKAFTQLSPLQVGSTVGYRQTGDKGRWGNDYDIDSVVGMEAQYVMDRKAECY